MRVSSAAAYRPVTYTTVSDTVLYGKGRPAMLESGHGQASGQGGAGGEGGRHRAQGMGGGGTRAAGRPGNRGGQGRPHRAPPRGHARRVLLAFREPPGAAGCAAGGVAGDQ